MSRSTKQVHWIQGSNDQFGTNILQVAKVLNNVSMPFCASVFLLLNRETDRNLVDLVYNIGRQNGIQQAQLR